MLTRREILEYINNKRYVIAEKCQGEKWKLKNEEIPIFRDSSIYVPILKEHKRYAISVLSIDKIFLVVLGKKNKINSNNFFQSYAEDYKYEIIEEKQKEEKTKEVEKIDFISAKGSDYKFERPKTFKVRLVKEMHKGIVAEIETDKIDYVLYSRDGEIINSLNNYIYTPCFNLVKIVEWWQKEENLNKLIIDKDGNFSIIDDLILEFSNLDGWRLATKEEANNYFFGEEE